MLHAAICRCLAKMMENDQEVLTLIQSNLSYAISGNDDVFDVFTIERQICQLKDEINRLTELASKTEGNTERYKTELKKMFDQLVVLRDKLNLAKIQVLQNDTVNSEVSRITDMLRSTNMNFTEYNDITVRRLVEYIQVCGKEKIIVTLKGGYQAEEFLNRK